MGVEIQSVYEGELQCVATHVPSQSRLRTDAPLDNGGRAASFSPTDLVAAALGTCMLTIMGLVAQRHGIDIRGTRVSVVKEMAREPVRRIAGLRVVVRVPASVRLSADDKVRLERGAMQCPVKHSLHPDVNVEVEWVYEGE